MLNLLGAAPVSIVDLTILNDLLLAFIPLGDDWLSRRFGGANIVL